MDRLINGVSGLDQSHSGAASAGDAARAGGDTAAAQTGASPWLGELRLSALMNRYMIVSTSARPVVPADGAAADNEVPQQFPE